MEWAGGLGEGESSGDGVGEEWGGVCLEGEEGRGLARGAGLRKG